MLLLLSYLKGRGNFLSEAVVFAGARDIDKGINLPGISFSINEVSFSYEGFNDFTNNEGMASQVKVVDSLTLKIYRAFFNEGGCF